MRLVINAPPARTLAISGSDARFPVDRIFCVGRNYAAHAREMGSDPTREPPFFFMKPSSALVDASEPAVIDYPRMTKNLHHEVELVVAIAVGGADIPLERALDHVFGYAVGLDMTRRDLQFAARDAGRPWEFGKAFFQGAPIGAIKRASELGHPTSGAIALSVNGAVKQSSDVSNMIWSVAECVRELSRYEPLMPGDLLMTGTPEGVGAVVRGDVMRGTIAGLDAVEVTVRA